MNMTLEQLKIYTDITGRLMILIDVVLFYALWNIFYHEAREKLTIIAGFVFLAIKYFISITDMPSLVLWLICSVIIVIYSVIRYGKHCERAVFAVILFYSMRCMCWLFSVSISQMFANYNTDRITEMDGPVEKLFLNAFISQLIFFLVYTLLFAAMLLVLNRAFNVYGLLLNATWYDAAFLSVFNIISILFVSIIANLNVVPLENDTFVLFESRTDLYWKLPLISLLLFIGQLILIIVFQKYKELQKREELYFAEKLQVKAMKLRLEEAEGFYDNIRSVKHEMKNHLMNIRSLVSDEKYRDVDEYISKLDVSMEKLEFKFSTGNALTDVIINDKCRQAEKLGIEFAAEFSYRDIDGIDVFDFGIVLNNLLDNAIAACENDSDTKRFIKVSLRHKKRFVILEIENSLYGQVVFSDDGLPATTKPTDMTDAPMGHGVGLKNVREIAGRYFGTLDIKVEGNVFKATVLMQERRAERC